MTPLSHHIHIARQITILMDLKFNILGIRFGIDPILDFIPGLGNILAAATSFYLFWIGFQLRVPSWVYLRMFWNILVDYIFGWVPFVGIFFDLFFRSNVRNLALLEKYFDPDILTGEVIEPEKS